MTTDIATARPPLTLLSEDEIAFRDAVAGFAADEVKPRVAARWSGPAKIDPALIKQYFEMGLMGIEVPEQYGGAGGSLMMVTLAVEEISKVDAAAAIMVDVQNTLVNYPINRYGSDALKAKYLPRLTTDTIGAYALSEPGSGSDAFGMATRAEQKRRHVGPHRPQDVDHQRRRGGDLRRVRQRGSGRGLQGDHGVHRRARVHRASRSARRRTSSAFARRARPS